MLCYTYICWSIQKEQQQHSSDLDFLSLSTFGGYQYQAGTHSLAWRKYFARKYVRGMVPYISSIKDNVFFFHVQFKRTLVASCYKPASRAIRVSVSYKLYEAFALESGFQQVNQVVTKVLRNLFYLLPSSRFYLLSLFPPIIHLAIPSIHTVEIGCTNLAYISTHSTALILPRLAICSLLNEKVYAIHFFVAVPLTERPPAFDLLRS